MRLAPSPSHAPPTLRVLLGLAMGCLSGCSDPGGFSRLPDGGTPAGSSGGNPGSGGRQVGTGGVEFATGGNGGVGHGGNVSTGGVIGTGGRPSTGGVTGSGGAGGGGGPGGSASGGTRAAGGGGQSATGGGGQVGQGGTAGVRGTGGMGGATTTGPCAGLCANPTTLAPGVISGNLGIGASCHQVIPTVAVPITGLVCGNFVAPRTLSVNGGIVSCAGNNVTLPPEKNGGYCMQATAGQYSYAYFTTFK